MIVKVEGEYCGHDRFRFRLTLPNGKRESVPGREWTRAVAADALTVLERVYGYSRRNIRFRHR